MNISHLLAVLRARWIPAVVVFVLVAGGAIAYTLTLPKVFTATAAVVIDAKPDPVSSMLYGGVTSPALINTQIEVMKSDRVTQRVIKNLKLGDMADLRQQWERASKGNGTIDDWLVDVMQRGMVASVAKAGSNVINISYSAGDARFAAAMANGYVQAYMETSIELRVDPARQYNTFFSGQVKEARDNLEKAQLRLSKYQQDKGIIGTDDRLDIEMSRLSSLSQELVAMQMLASESSSRQAQAGANAGQMSEVLSSGVVSGLKAELARAEGRLLELSAKYGSNHPQVQDARTAVRDLQARITAETRNVTGGVAVNANINRAREARVRSELEAQRAKVLKLREVRDEGSVLARDVENAQRSYDVLLNRFNQTNLESQNRQSNATVLNQASVPLLPSSPKVGSNIGMGLVVALALGLGLAFALEQFDKRVRVPTDAFEALGLPVIGIMPTPAMGRRTRGQLALTQERVVSGRKLLPPGKT